MRRLPARRPLSAAAGWVRPAAWWAAALSVGGAAAAPDAEQLHVSVVGESAVVVSWVSPRNKTAELAIEECEPSSSPGGAHMPLTGTLRRVRPDLDRYSHEPSDGLVPNASVVGMLYHSPLLLHASVNVTPSASYRYRIEQGDSTTEWRHFRAPPAAGAGRLRLAIVGDLGQTHHSRRTCEGLAGAHAANALDAGVLLGDLAYADGVPPRWDSFGRMFDEAGCADIPWLVLPGNHEIEPDALSGEPFLPYRKRWRTPQAMPEEVDANYSVNDWGTYNITGRYDFGGSFYGLRLGPVHFVVLNPYTDSARGSKQEAWLRQELARVDRRITPLLAVFTHAPWNHTSLTHQPHQETATESLLAMAGPLLAEAGADVVFSGHVHAYERRGGALGQAMQIVAGNGGNKEQLYNEWINGTSSAYRTGEYYGWGEFDVYKDASTWLMRRNTDSAIIDSLTRSHPPAPTTRGPPALHGADELRQDGPGWGAYHGAVAVAVFSTSSLACMLVRRARKTRQPNLEAAALRGHSDLSPGVAEHVVGRAHPDDIDVQIVDRPSK